MKITRKLFAFVAAILCISIFATSASAAGYTAMIVQGNTPDVGDCKVVFDYLKDVPSGNTYTISNRGWHYNSGNSYHNYTKWLNGYSSDPEYALACKQDLIDAGTHDVLYWSGHGGRNPIRLNVHPNTNDYGPGASSQPTINIASALKVDTSDWRNTCVWKNSNLKVAMFAACQVLDNDFGDCKYLVRAMQASNVRAIAGYHLTSPTNPTDTAIAKAFFYNATNGGVTGGESIRSSWQTANEMNGQGARWAVLCYKSDGNQYYRIPGFPGKPYPEPTDKTVYRFWSAYTSATGGQEMTTGLDDELGDLPLELVVSSANARSSDPSRGLTVYRELCDDGEENLDESDQRLIAADYLDEKYLTGIETVGTVTCEEMDPDIGVVPGSATVVGKTFCYNNQYNGIRMLNNFYKVATDADGVYFTIDKWSDVADSSEDTTATCDIIPAEDVLGIARTSENLAIENMAIVYVPVSENTYRLCYEITLEDSAPYYVDCVSGEEVTIFVG